MPEFELQLHQLLLLTLLLLNTVQRALRASRLCRLETDTAGKTGKSERNSSFLSSSVHCGDNTKKQSGAVSEREHPRFVNYSVYLHSCSTRPLKATGIIKHLGIGCLGRRSQLFQLLKDFCYSQRFWMSVR